MLTKKHSDVLHFIHDRLKESDVSPSFEEMAAAIGLRSKSTIWRIILELEENGWIRRMPHRARSIQVLKIPDPQSRQTKLNLIQGDPRKNLLALSQEPVHAAQISIPMMGRIAAGTPISALQVCSHSICMPPDLSLEEEYFALSVRGDSMIEAGIFDNDTVIIKKQNTAETGNIVVALIDNEEATLKRLRKRGAAIALEAANLAYESRIFAPNRITILGKLVKLMRQY